SGNPVASPPVYETTVAVDHLKPDSSLIAREKHVYFGSAARSLMDARPYSYPPYQQGREKRTEFYRQDGTQLLRQEITADWQQRAPVGWWTGDPLLAPANDPRLLQQLTILDTNQTSKQTFAYDAYNNRTDVYEYDFGAGAPGALLRHT